MYGRCSWTALMFEAAGVVHQGCVADVGSCTAGSRWQGHAANVFEWRSGALGCAAAPSSKLTSLSAGGAAVLQHARHAAATISRRSSLLVFSACALSDTASVCVCFVTTRRGGCGADDGQGEPGAQPRLQLCDLLQLRLRGGGAPQVHRDRAHVSGRIASGGSNVQVRRPG